MLWTIQMCLHHSTFAPALSFIVVSCPAREAHAVILHLGGFSSGSYPKCPLPSLFIPSSLHRLSPLAVFTLDTAFYSTSWGRLVICLEWQTALCVEMGSVWEGSTLGQLDRVLTILGKRVYRVSSPWKQPHPFIEISVQIPYIPEFLAWVLSKPHVLWVSLIPASPSPVPSLDWRWNAGISHNLLLMASRFPSHSYGCFPPSLCPEIQHDSWCLHCMQISVGFLLLGQTPLDCLLFSKMLCISLSAMAGSPTLVPVGLDCDYSSPVV